MKPIAVPTTASPLLDAKDYAAPSVFRADNLLREARRQKGLPAEPVPDVCVLDPDGDIVRLLRQERRAEPMLGWACYHTELMVAVHGGVCFGLIGCAVGASFAVLLAEQLFASGCRLLLSVTSAGQIVPVGPTPYFVLIDRALRDEGTSLHYLPPGAFAAADRALADRAMAALADRPCVRRGATWTTDAPFRETEAAVERARSLGVLGVEMEAAALYAFATSCRRPVLCFAHVTNQMAQVHGDFEKGEANGAIDALNLLAAVAKGCAS
ncbi:MAG TPA: nucleoside phosphorylase [Acidisphaera sp.]|nr:nucleoside phosphorylase [Acidisphaera sp.]